MAKITNSPDVKIARYVIIVINIINTIITSTITNNKKVKI